TMASSLDDAVKEMVGAVSQGVAASATEEIPTVAAIEADLKELLGEKAEAEAAATAEGEEKK
ncbi:hypothetical protein Tco_1358107, partial [Tanacetum coccineum]